MLTLQYSLAATPSSCALASTTRRRTRRRAAEEGVEWGSLLVGEIGAPIVSGTSERKRRS